jgi:hypothetical protein
MADAPHFVKDNLPGEFHDFRKVAITRAMRINGPFTVTTIDGNVCECADGWLAIDENGYPYPIDHSTFIISYIPVEFDGRRESEAA